MSNDTQWYPASEKPDNPRPEYGFWVDLGDGVVRHFPSLGGFGFVRWTYATPPPLPKPELKWGELVYMRSFEAKKDDWNLEQLANISGEYYYSESGFVYDECRRPTAEELASMGLMRVPSVEAVSLILRRHDDEEFVSRQDEAEWLIGELTERGE